MSKIAKNLARTNRIKPKASSSAHHHHHPDHSRHLPRISRVRGQVNGIEKMILEKRYCPDILTQLKAARAAISAIEAEIFKTHLRGCVKQAFNATDEVDCERKIDEIVKIVY